MKLVVLVFLCALAYVQAEEGCLVSNQAAIVPQSSTMVMYMDNRATEYYENCTEDFYFVEECMPGGVAIKSMQHGTYLEPYVDVDGSTKIRLSSDSFDWQKELVNGKFAYYTTDVVTFGDQGKYLSACWDWLTLAPEVLNCESFEFQQIPEN